MVFRIEYNKEEKTARVTVNDSNGITYGNIETIAEVAEVLEAYITNEI